MRWFSASRLGVVACAIVLSLGLGRGLQADTVVYSNNPAPGDWVVGSGSPGLSVAIGASGWNYSDVRTDGYIGIRTDHPYNGNGSVLMQTTSTTGKAEVELRNLTTGFGKLKDLNSFSYSWLRDGASTAASWTGPVARLLISDGTSAGYLVWEQYFNGYHPGGAPTNTWVNSDAYNSGNGVFSTYGSGLGQLSGIDAKFTDWVNGGGGITKAYGDWTVIGINMGIGSGLGGTLIGAADNLTIGFTNGTPTTYNFEVVPEPSSIVLSIVAGGIGLVAAARRRFRQSA